MPSALNSGTLAAGLTESTDRGELTDFSEDSVDSIAYTATADTDDSWWVTAQSGTTANITGSSIVLNGTVGSVQQFGLTATAKPGLGTQPGLYQGVIEWTCSVTQP